MDNSPTLFHRPAPRVGCPTFLFILIGVLFTSCASVEPTPPSSEPYAAVEVDSTPLPARGNLIYRKFLREKGIYGTALTKITVAADGHVSDIVVLKADNDAMAAELPALVRTWRFTPASKNGKSVACYVLMQCKSAPTENVASPLNH